MTPADVSYFMPGKAEAEIKHFLFMTIIVPLINYSPFSHIFE